MSLARIPECTLKLTVFILRQQISVHVEMRLLQLDVDHVELFLEAAGVEHPLERMLVARGCEVDARI